MRRVAAAAGVVLAVVAAALVVWTQFDGEREAGSDTSPSGDPVSPSAGDAPEGDLASELRATLKKHRVRAHADEDEANAAAAGPPDLRCAFVVPVWRADGHAASGATVVISYGVRQRTSATDGYGMARFTISDVAELAGLEQGSRFPGTVRLDLNVRAEAGGEVGVGRRAFRWPPERADDDDVMPVAMIRTRSAVRVAGTVTDEDGAPVENATCTLSWCGDSDDPLSQGLRDHEDTVTSAGGRIVFPALPRNDPEQTGLLEVSAPGFAYLAPGLTVSGAGDEAVAVRLEREYSVGGRCVDTAGTPLVGASVTAAPTQWATYAHTGPDGRFLIQRVRSSQRRATIETRDLPTITVVIPGDGRHDVDLGDIVIPSGVTLRARIEDADGLPVAWSIVDILPDDEDALWHHADKTDAAGRFDREQMPAGTVRLAVHHPRCAAGAVVPVAHVATGTAEDVSVVLPRLPEVTLRFVGETDRQPRRVGKATITVWAADDTSKKTEFDAFTYDVAGDRIALIVPRAGAYVATVEVAGFAPVHVDNLVTGGEASVGLRETAK